MCVHVLDVSAWPCRCVFSHTCACLFASVRTHTDRDGFSVCVLTDSLLFNEQLFAITIHEPCHSPPLKAPAPETLKPQVSH